MKVDQSDHSTMIQQEEGTVDKLWLIKWPSTEDKRCVEALKLAYANMLKDVYENGDINREIGVMSAFNTKLMPIPKMQREDLS
jgi:hypothetical protein